MTHRIPTSSNTATRGVTGIAATTRRSAAPPRSLALTDALAITVLVTAASASFGSAYGGSRWLFAAAGGAALGAAIAGWTAARNWPALLNLPAVVVAYFIFGAPLATPTAAIAGILPSVESTRLLAVGAVTSWRQLLTVTTPVGTAGALLVPVYLSALVLAAIGVTLCGRTRVAWTALLAPLAMMVIAALFGTRTGNLAQLSGTVPALGAVVWVSWRTHLAAGPRGGGLDPHRPVAALSVLVLAIVAAVFLAPVVPPGGARVALRDAVEQPLDPQQYPSPLSAFRKYVKADAETPMFTVTGLPANTPIRLAALDAYDGVVYKVSDATGGFDRIGDVVADPGPGQPVRVHIEITGYTGLWLPTVGGLAGISFEGSGSARLADNFRYAKGIATGIVTSGVAKGDSYSVDARVPVMPSAAELAAAVQGPSTPPAPEQIPDAVKSAALTDTKGASGVYQKAKNIADVLSQQGVLSHGGASAGGLATPAGHGVGRLNQLLTAAVMTGDGEQFAPAMALMLRTLGIPARVVLGFRPDPTYDGTGPLAVTGSNISAWVEVDFAGYGWVPFFPTPISAAVPPAPDTQQAASPRQQVQPPQPPPPAQNDAKAEDVGQGAADPEPPATPPGPPAASPSHLGLWLGIGIPLLILLIAVLTLLLIKSRRQVRRRRAVEPLDRVVGGWNQLLDAATDLGRPVPRHLTRSEAAGVLDEHFGTATVALADRADAQVFSGATLGDAEVAAFWAEVDRTVQGFGAGQSMLRRLRGRLSTASLRRRV